MPRWKPKRTPISEELLRCTTHGGGVVYGKWVLFKPELRRGQFWERVGDDFEPRHEVWAHVEKWEYADSELQAWDEERQKRRKALGLKRFR